MRRAALALVPLFVLCASMPAASADPIADKRREAEQVARQLDEQGRRVSVLAEEYNAARLEADRVEARMASAAAELAVTQARADDARRQLRAQAVASYVNGGSAPALAMLVESRLDDLSIRRQYVRSVTTNTSDAIDDLRAATMALEDEQQSLAAARAAARAAVEEVAGRRTAAADAESEQRQLLAGVRGELSTLVAAENRRRAEVEERNAKAALAARLEREAASREAAARATTTTGPPRVTTTTTPPKSAAAPSATSTPSPSPSPGAPNKGAEAAVAEAKRQLGKPYRYGASGPDSFDCSGLTSWAWKAGGVTLSHSSRAQWGETRRVAIGDLLPGDLVFYGDPIHHVGIYVGDGQMVEASETGTPVRQTTIFRKDLVGAGRVN